MRAATAAREPGAAHAATARMRADVQRLVSTGDLSATDGHVMLTELTRVDGRISVEVHAAPPKAAPPAAAPAPAPEPGHKPGKGHDHKGGDGGD